METVRSYWPVVLLLTPWLVASCTGPVNQATPITPPPTGAPQGSGENSRVPSVIGSLSPTGETQLQESQRQRRAGNFAAAETAVRRAMEADPDHPSLWLELGQIRFEQGDYPAAEAMGNRSLSLAPEGSVAQSQAAQLIADSQRARKRL